MKPPFATQVPSDGASFRAFERVAFEGVLMPQFTADAFARGLGRAARHADPPRETASLARHERFCDVCGERTKLRCARCRGVAHCSMECQRRDTVRLKMREDAEDGRTVAHAERRLFHPSNGLTCVRSRIATRRRRKPTARSTSESPAEAAAHAELERNRGPA